MPVSRATAGNSGKSLQWSQLCVPLGLAACQSVFSASLVPATHPASQATLMLPLTASQNSQSMASQPPCQISRVPEFSEAASFGCPVCVYPRPEKRGRGDVVSRWHNTPHSSWGPLSRGPASCP